MPWLGGPVGSEVTASSAPPVPSPPSRLPGAGRHPVAATGLIPGQAPAGRGAVGLRGPGTLSGQAGFSLPLC